MGVIILQSKDKYIGADTGNISNFYSDRQDKTLTIIFKDNSRFVAIFGSAAELINAEKVFSNMLLTGGSLLYNAEISNFDYSVTEASTIAGVSNQ